MFKLQDPTFSASNVISTDSGSMPRTAKPFGQYPATDEVIGTVPRMGRLRPAPPSRRPTRPFRPGGPGPPGSAPCSCAAGYELLLENKEDLAILMTAEQGKPLAESAARSSMPPRSSNGLPKRESGSTATPSPPFRTTSGSLSSRSRSASAQPSPLELPAAMIPARPGRRWPSAAP